MRSTDEEIEEAVVNDEEDVDAEEPRE